MGYPEHKIPSTRTKLFPCFSLILLLSFILPTQESYAAPSLSRSGLPPGDWDHLIITDQSMIRSFTPLADHRTAQGLPSRIISLQELQRYSLQSNLRDAIRWFVSAAQQQWGTRYVLLGGDAEIIPVPMGYFERYSYSWEIPLDLYYAAPNGNWDQDADGILGEFGQDDPDLIPVVALGRAPVDDAQEALSFVNKVITFETQDDIEMRDVLLVAEVQSPIQWVPGQEIGFDFAWLIEGVVQILASLDFFGNFERLYENWEAYGGALPLSPEAFIQAMDAGNHRFLSLMTRGVCDTWSMGSRYLTTEDLDPLEGMDHSIFMVPVVPEATDCRPEGILEKMFSLPQGGCIGALGPSSMFYIFPVNSFTLGFWQDMVDNPHQRVGDGYRHTLEDLVESLPLDAANLASIQCMSIYGDPALSLLPLTRDVLAADPRVKSKLSADASPNPFNPATEISFTLPGSSGAPLPTVVEIFDLAGRRLTRLVDEDLAPGPHSVRWRGEDDSGRSVGSGLFFARILAADQQAVVKLILIE